MQWSQDATRIGSLVNLDSPRGEEELKGLMLYNLARLHSNNEDFDEIYAMIKRSYITHHVSSHPTPHSSGLTAHLGI